MPQTVLALDQGTTSSRAIVFDHSGQPVATEQEEFPQLFPQPGWVEHDPEAIWQSQLRVAQRVLKSAQVSAGDVAALGITNQRETTIVWDRHTGRPVANAIVWQSRVTADICRRWQAEGLEETVRAKTGLVIDAYFSASKIKHLLDTVEGLRPAAERGDVLFGTVDSFLVWRLTGGRLHITDYTNASRTLIYNLHTLDWDDELLAAFDIPRAMLPEVRALSEIYGETDASHFGRPIRIGGLAGDQQAATFGQGCFEPGTAKNTYGTGCFLLQNTGRQPIHSQHGLLTTIGCGGGGELNYCLEGAIFIAGAAIQWLRDGLGILEDSAASEQIAAQVDDSDGVYFVPALVGLGAPHWNPRARGTILGITRGTQRAHIVRAALDAMAFQTREVLDAMAADAGQPQRALQVDGGATRNDLLMQFQADILGIPVRRPMVQETTALGAAYLAGLAVGFWSDCSDVSRNWALDREFQPTMDRTVAERLYQRWQEAVRRSLDWQD